MDNFERILASEGLAPLASDPFLTSDRRFGDDGEWSLFDTTPGDVADPLEILLVLESATDLDLAQEDAVIEESPEETPVDPEDEWQALLDDY